MEDILKIISQKQSEISREITFLKNQDATDFYLDYKAQNQQKPQIPKYIKVGNLISGSISYPALLPFSNLKGLAFELNETNREEVNLTMEYIALQLIELIPSEYFSFTLIDPKRLGGNFRNLRRLKAFIGDIEFDKKGIQKLINNHYDESVRVINECLINYSSIKEYNKNTGEKQPFRFIFISDFPYGFEGIMDKFYTILYNSKEAGVFVFMTYDSTIDMGSHRAEINEVVNQMTVLREFGDPNNDFYKISNIVNPDFYNRSHTVELDRSDINPDKIDNKINELLSKFKKDISFEPGEGIRIPIGKLAGRTFYFTFGHDTSAYHAIIGGQSGKGKSVLLNNIIARGIEVYQKEDLAFLLIDCAGVGFQEFKNSSHITALYSSSDVEESLKGINELEEELKRREQLFRELEVQKLKDYNKKANHKLPRLICLIDEFHVLFTGRSRTSSYVESILVNKIIRIGRKFGMHLIVSTQSLGSGVRRSFLDNIPLRIALGMNEDQSAGFLGHKNTAATNLEVGVAVYNDQNGAVNANRTVRVDYLKSDQIKEIIRIAESK